MMVALVVLGQGLGMGPDLVAKVVRIHLQRIRPLLPKPRAQLRPQNETVRMDALRGAEDLGWLEPREGSGAENLQHRRGLLQPRELRSQSGALLGGGLESEAHTPEGCGFNL